MVYVTVKVFGITVEARFVNVNEMRKSLILKARIERRAY